MWKSMFVTLIQSIRDGATLVSGDRAFELGLFNPINSTKRYLGLCGGNCAVLHQLLLIYH